MPRTTTVFRFIFSLLRTRAAWAVLWAFFAFWLFDRLVYFATETQWFASLELTALWWARCRAQSELFFGFTLLALLLTRLFLAPVGRIALTSLPLRGKLAVFESMRGGVYGFSATVVTLIALLQAGRFTHHWPEWLLLRAGSPLNFGYLGLPGALWMQWLPIITPLLRALWAFSWLLLLLTALTGVLRALPELAARRPMPPVALTRTLWTLGAWLLGLRAAMHGTAVLDLARGRALQTGDVIISAPIFLAGFMVCIALAALALRRVASVTTRRRFSKLAFTMAAAMWLPGVLNWFTAPVRSLLPETRWLKRARQQATSVAWQLDFKPPSATPAGVKPETVWPVWNEKMLLPTRDFRTGNLVIWKSATIARPGKQWSAIAVGESAGATAWNANRETSDATRLTLERFDDISSPTGPGKGTPLTGVEAFFGFEGRTLLTSENFGVPISSIATKWLWAWRLRDLFLAFESAESSHLLVFRGAQEIAERIAPFWKATDSPQLVLQGNEPFWLIDLCATNSHFPGAMPVRQGELEGKNAASDSIKMLLDARTGAVSFFALPPDKTDPLQASWRAALPNALRAASELPVDIQQQWRAAPSMLSAQLTMHDESRSSRAGERRTVAAQPGAGDEGRPVTRALSIGNDTFESLEARQGLNRERVLRSGDFNLMTRLAAIETELAKVPQPKGSRIEAGDPSVWPDADSPGGFRLGRAFFQVPQEKAAGASSNPATRLWKVALTGMTKDVPVLLNDSARLESPAASQLPARQSNGAKSEDAPTATAALRAHDAAQVAARFGKWSIFARESARERKILQQLAKQSSLKSR